MKCSNCGGNVNAGQRFCAHCGAELPQQDAASDGNKMILTVFAAICGVIYGFRAIGEAISLVRFLFGGYFVWGIVPGLLMLVFNLLLTVTSVWLCLCLLLTALRWTREISDGLLLCICGGAVARVVVFLLDVVIMNIILGRFAGGGLTVFRSILGALVTVGGVYLILRFLMGENPILGKTMQDLQNDLKLTFTSVSEMIGKVSAGKGQNVQPQGQAMQGQDMQPQGQAVQGQDMQFQGQPMQNSQPAWNAGPIPNGQYGANGQVASGVCVTPMFRLKTDRSLLWYIVLSILTCGIYGWYFIYALARDLNVACAGDGRSTGGLIKFVLLSTITCGIYAWIWWYGVGNRLAVNAPRYGMTFPENGTTILMWMLFGSLLCGIGPFIAMHIIIKNMNMLCGAYNHAHNM